MVDSPPISGCTGLIALWHEGLLTQAVLAGQTRGYQSRSQLARFKAQNQSLAERF